MMFSWDVPWRMPLFVLRKPVKATDSWILLVGRNLSIIPPPYFPILYYKQTNQIIYKTPRMKMHGRTPYSKIIKYLKKTTQSIQSSMGAF